MGLRGVFFKIYLKQIAILENKAKILK